MLFRSELYTIACREERSYFKRLLEGYKKREKQDVEKGQIDLIVTDLFGIICILFLRDFAAGRLGKCANPDCQAPFFVRSRKTQRFCDAPVCIVYSHRLSANNYWRKRRKQ